MREFNRLHSGTDPSIFLNTWISHDSKFLIQLEIGEGYGIIPNISDMGKNHVIEYHRIPVKKRRNTTMRNCLETYYKLQNEL